MLLDTSGLMCLFDKRDWRHTAAVELYDSTTPRLTHNYVFAEFVALAIARRAPLADALKFLNAIHSSDEIQVVWVDPALHERAMLLLGERGDKLWTLCDAVSIVVMTDRNILAALTTDNDFEQAGLIRLLDK